jgi:5'-nucleotidase
MVTSAMQLLYHAQSNRRANEIIMDGFSTSVPATRRIYANRTLNLRDIGAVGFDMDYTLVHYDVEAWEGAAFAAAKSILLQEGLAVESLAFDHTAFSRGLVLDLQYGNVVKANRFGYPKRASHGTVMLPWREQRDLYARTFVDLRDKRWVFLNTLFSLSMASLFAQLVDRIDRNTLPGVASYQEAFERVSRALFRVHTEGHIKDAVIANPSAFIAPDPETPLALLDLRHAGKKLALITNSGWKYTRAVMEHTFDPYLSGESWRSLFDVVMVAARKPTFFTREDPVYQVVDTDQGLLQEHMGPLAAEEAYHGGNASMVEEAFGLSGQSILYVGDHVFADVNVSKKLLRWRTGLVVRELEEDLGDAAENTGAIAALMHEKRSIEHLMSVIRLKQQRLAKAYGPQPTESAGDLANQLDAHYRDIEALDARVSPLVAAQGTHGNDRWGSLFRAGNDKSHLARQVERYADFYTSRVSNLMWATPHAYLRSDRGNLPHDG